MYISSPQCFLKLHEFSVKFGCVARYLLNTW